MNTKFSLKFKIVTIVFFCLPILKAQTPVALTNVIGDTLTYNPTALWDQIHNPGINSVTSQNFESLFDTYDSYAAEQFGLMDATWSVTKVEVRGAYFSGSGIAESVNVWFFNDSSGYPGQVIHLSMNVIPSNGLTTGSFSIPLSFPLELTEGIYWICVQANMSFNSSGQWGWTTSTSYFMNESVWKNPGAGFGTICTNWNYRASNCGIGTSPGLCFALIGDIIPVELTSFTASANGKDIILEWLTATELNNQGFEVERLKDSKIEKLKEWVKIGFVNGNGTTIEPQSYSFVDGNISLGKYIYRLKQIDFDGTFEYSNTIEVDISLPEKFSLEQNYPNPFNPVTSIKFTIPTSPLNPSPYQGEGNRERSVTLKVYDVLGNEVATLVNEEKTAGSYEVEFLGHSDGGQNLSSGVYLYQLSIIGPETSSGQGLIQTKKMILMK